MLNLQHLYSPPGKRFMINLPRSVTLLALATVVAACADSPQPGQTDATVPRWTGVADLTVDSLGGTTTEFGILNGIAVDPAGRMVIADGRRNILSVFDSSGRFRYALGTGSTGPGELNQPCCLAFDGAGTLWVRDSGHGRYSRYEIGDTSGRFLGGTTVSGVTGGDQATLTMDGAGRLVEVRALSSGEQPGIIRSHVDSTGHIVMADSIPGPTEDSLGERRIPLGQGFRYLYQPYGPTFLVAHAPGGGWARAVSSHYIVRWVVDGDTARTLVVRRDLIGPALSARERARADSVLAAEAGSLGLSGAAVPFGVPGSKTPVKDIFFDQGGRLWVQLNVGDGELNRADVYDRSGRRVANAEWPSGVDLGAGYVGDRVAYGIRRDSMNVPQVVRLRFR